MQPLQITFRNIQPSQAIERLVRLKARKLEEFHDRIVKCRVRLEAEHPHHQKGNLYDVHLDIEIPGKSFAVTSARHENHAYESLSSAVRDAFESAERQLRDYMGSRRNRSRDSNDSRSLDLPISGDLNNFT